MITGGYRIYKQASYLYYFVNFFKKFQLIFRRVVHWDVRRNGWQWRLFPPLFVLSLEINNCPINYQVRVICRLKPADGFVASQHLLYSEARGSCLDEWTA